MIDPQIILEILKLHGVSSEMVKQKLPETIKAMEQYFLSHIDEGKYIPLTGAVVLLQTLRKKNAYIGVLSGNIETVGWSQLQKSDLKQFIDFGIFSDHFYKRSELIIEAQRKIQKVLKRNVSLRDLVIIGDSPRDVACAKEGKIESIAVASGNFSEEQLKESGADLVVSSLSQRKEILDFLNIQ